MNKNTKSYEQVSISKKKKYARETMNLKAYKGEEFRRRQEILFEIEEQIGICEELRTPLSLEMIKELCGMQSISNVLSYCRRVKLA